MTGGRAAAGVAVGVTGGIAALLWLAVGAVASAGPWTDAYGDPVIHIWHGVNRSAWLALLLVPTIMVTTGAWGVVSTLPASVTRSRRVRRLCRFVRCGVLAIGLVAAGFALLLLVVQGVVDHATEVRAPDGAAVLRVTAFSDDSYVQVYRPAPGHRGEWVKDRTAQRPWRRGQPVLDTTTSCTLSLPRGDERTFTCGRGSVVVKGLQP